MAEKRMFSAKIIESDAFLDIPATAQMLYFHICMNADDDGFVNNPRKIIRMCGASEDDLKALIDNRFLLMYNERKFRISSLCVQQEFLVLQEMIFHAAAMEIRQKARHLLWKTTISISVLHRRTMQKKF